MTPSHQLSQAKALCHLLPEVSLTKKQPKPATDTPEDGDETERAIIEDGGGRSFGGGGGGCGGGGAVLHFGIPGLISHLNGIVPCLLNERSSLLIIFFFFSISPKFNFLSFLFNFIYFFRGLGFSCDEEFIVPHMVMRFVFELLDFNDLHDGVRSDLFFDIFKFQVSSF